MFALKDVLHNIFMYCIDVLISQNSVAFLSFLELIKVQKFHI